MAAGSPPELSLTPLVFHTALPGEERREGSGVPGRTGGSRDDGESGGPCRDAQPPREANPGRRVDVSRIAAALGRTCPKGNVFFSLGKDKCAFFTLNFTDRRGASPDGSLPSPCWEKVGRCLLQHRTPWDAPSPSDLRRQAERWRGSPKALFGGASSPPWMVPVEGTGCQAMPTCSPGVGRAEDMPALIPSSVELSASLRTRPRAYFPGRSRACFPRGIKRGMVGWPYFHGWFVFWQPPCTQMWVPAAMGVTSDGCHRDC